MTIIRQFTFSLLFLLPALVLGQTSVLFDDAGDVFAGIGSVYTAPLRWDARDWTFVGGLAVATGAAFLLDDELRAEVRVRSSFSGRLNALGNAYGQWYYAMAFAGGTYALGFVAEDTWLRGTGVALLQTLLAAGTLNLVLKTAVGRSRPHENRGNADFHPWAWDERMFSFPSGHAVMAFSLSSVLAARVNNAWATVAFYSLAGITAWSRMYSDNHWFSDVVVGGAVASAVGLSLVKRYEERKQSKVSILPIPRGFLLHVVL